MNSPVNTLGAHIKILSGFAFKSEHFNTDGTGLPLIRIRDVVPGFSSTYYAGTFDDQFLIKDGSLLIGMDGEFNRAVWQGGDALLNQRVCRIDPNPAILDARFLYHILPAALKAIEARTSFVTVKHLSSKDIQEITIALPPLDKQRRIAAILDQADNLRRKRRTALERLEKLRGQTFLESFGDWSRPGYNGSLISLGDCLDFLTSGSRGWAAYYKEVGSRFLRIQNVGSDELILLDTAYVEPPDTAESRRTRVKPGDVLLSITADLGRSAVVPHGIGDCYINQHLCILRSSTLEPSFLSAAIASPAGQRIIHGKNRAGVKAGLNFDDVRSLEIPDVERSQQQAFAARVAEIDTLKTAYRAHLQKLDALFGSLQHRAFRGEL